MRIEVVRERREGAWRRVFIVRVRVGGDTVVEVVMVYRGLASSMTVSETGGDEGVDTTFTDGGIGSMVRNWGVV